FAASYSFAISGWSRLYCQSKWTSCETGSALSPLPFASCLTKPRHAGPSIDFKTARLPRLAASRKCGPLAFMFSSSVASDISALLQGALAQVAEEVIGDLLRRVRPFRVVPLRDPVRGAEAELADEVEVDAR